MISYNRVATIRLHGKKLFYTKENCLLFLGPGTSSLHAFQRLLAGCKARETNKQINKQTNKQGKVNLK